MKMFEIDALALGKERDVWRFVRVFDPAHAVFGELHFFPLGPVDLWFPPPLGDHHGWSPVGEVEVEKIVVPCPTCKGKGYLVELDASCPECRGEGALTEVGDDGVERTRACSRCPGGAERSYTCVSCHDKMMVRHKQAVEFYEIAGLDEQLERLSQTERMQKVTEYPAYHYASALRTRLVNKLRAA